MIFKSTISVLVLILHLSAAQTNTNTCKSKFISDFGPESCDMNKKEYYEENVNDCIPGCVTKGELGDGCNTINNPCAPGLECNQNKCVIDQTSCARFRYMSSKPKWMPSCLPDGTYALKQCKGEKSNGRCFCFNSDGKRIYGEAWSYKAEKMTCACSRRRADLEKAGRKDVTLHCDSLGNYETLQCDSGSCWCADQYTGEVLHSVVSETMMSILPCYKYSLVGDNYLRQCESQIIAQEKIKEEFAKHGTNDVNLPFLLCNYDGSYGAYVYEKGLAYCTWRDNSKLGPSQDSTTKADIDCNCARDIKLYELEGLPITKQCSGNGNYKKLQQIDKNFYCVDSDGFATTDPSPSLTEDDCPQY